jgi:hypothetical protein
MEIIKVSFIALVTSLVVVLLTGMTHASDVDTRVDHSPAIMGYRRLRYG